MRSGKKTFTLLHPKKVGCEYNAKSDHQDEEAEAEGVRGEATLISCWSTINADHARHRATVFVASPLCICLTVPFRQRFALVCLKVLFFGTVVSAVTSSSWDIHLFQLRGHLLWLSQRRLFVPAHVPLRPCRLRRGRGILRRQSRGRRRRRSGSRRRPGARPGGRG